MPASCLFGIGGAAPTPPNVFAAADFGPPNSPPSPLGKATASSKNPLGAGRSALGELRLSPRGLASLGAGMSSKNPLGAGRFPCFDEAGPTGVGRSVSLDGVGPTGVGRSVSLDGVGPTGAGRSANFDGLGPTGAGRSVNFDPVGPTGAGRSANFDGLGPTGAGRSANFDPVGPTGAGRSVNFDGVGPTGAGRSANFDPVGPTGAGRSARSPRSSALARAERGAGAGATGSARSSGDARRGEVNPASPVGSAAFPTRDCSASSSADRFMVARTPASGPSPPSGSPRSSSPGTGLAGIVGTDFGAPKEGRDFGIGGGVPNPATVATGRFGAGKPISLAFGGITVIDVPQPVHFMILPLGGRSESSSLNDVPHWLQVTLTICKEFRRSAGYIQTVGRPMATWALGAGLETDS